MATKSDVDPQRSVRAFTTHSEEWQEDPYPLYEMARAHCPVAHLEQNSDMWMVTRYEDVKSVLVNPRQFSSNDCMIDEDAVGNVRPLPPLQYDPPEHSRFRRALQAFFTLERARSFEDDVRMASRDLLDTFAGRGECDFNEDFAKLIPSLAFVPYVGWPVEDAYQFAQWGYDAIHGGESADGADLKRGAAENMYAYFGDLVARREMEPTDDVISQLLGVNGGTQLTPQEVVDVMFLLVLAGFDTTRKTLALGVAYLAQHPDLRNRITADLSLVPMAVEEILRYESVVSPVRVVTEDLEFGGQTIRAGAQILLPLGSADRDGNVFEDSDTMNIDRKPNRHIGFGHGPHRCLGMHFARLELQVTLEELHRRLPDYRLKPGASPQMHLHPARGIESLPLIFTPA